VNAATHIAAVSNQLSSSGVTGGPITLPARSQKKSIWTTVRQIFRRVVFSMRTYLPDNAVMPAEAVTAFLGTMASTATRTSGLWRQRFEIGLNECALSFDARHDFFKAYAVDDIYFAGIVALEAAKIRQLYSAADAAALLGEIGDQVDRAADRGDRMLSDMVFDIIGRIDMSSGPSIQKMPYDEVTKAILRQLDIHRNEATQELMADKAFRHGLGEPLALSVQNWWASFQQKFVLVVPPEPEPETPPDFTPTAIAGPKNTPRRRIRRAAAMI
jgi:hypothetical protein